MAKPNKGPNKPGPADYRPANGHTLSTGFRDAPQGQPDQSYKSGRSSGQDVNRQPNNPGGITLSDNYPTTKSTGAAKPRGGEVSGGVPRGFVNNEPGYQPGTTDVGSKRPDGSARVVFGGDIFGGYGDPNGGSKPDPTVTDGGRSVPGPGGAGV